MLYLFLPASIPISDVSFHIAINGFADVRPVLNLKYQAEEYAITILTDTLQLSRFWSINEHSTWFYIQGQGYQGHMTPYPWEDGAPALSKGFQTSYAGIEGGQLRTWKEQFYVGGEGIARYYWYRTDNENPLENRDNEFRLTFNTFAAWNTTAASVRLVLGEDIVNTKQFELQPHLYCTATYRPDWTFAPWLELRAGWGDNQDNISKMRLGGLNPYVVPFAGAGWGEWWVEDYLVSRVGSITQIPIKKLQMELGIHSDLGYFQNISAISFGQYTGVSYNDWKGIIHWGMAPWIERQDGVSFFSSYISIARGWD